MPDTSPQSLADQSACYQCAGVSLTDGMILALLSQVITHGGVGGIATQYLVTAATNSPVAGAGTTITAQLADTNGNPITTSGLIVTWSNTGTDGSFSSPTSVTNASGIATITFTSDLANVSYVITATDNHGLHGNTVVITSVIGPFTANWVSRVGINGGAAPSSIEQAAADRYYRRCVTASIDGLMMTDILPCNNNIIASTTPFFFNNGFDPWVLIGGGPLFNNSDCSVNGIQGKVNAGIKPVLTPSAFSDTSASLIVYHYALDTLTNSISLGLQNGAGGLFGIGNQSAGQQLHHFCWGTSTLADCITVGTLGGTQGNKGYILGTRTSNTDIKLYGANSTSAWATIGSGNGSPLTNTRAAVAALEIFGMCWNNNGTPAAFINAIVSYMGIARGLTSVQGNAHYDAVQQFLTTKGGGFV